jgi:hypothetical protein
VWSRGCGMVDSVGPSALPCPCLFFLSCRCQREVSLELLGLESFSNATPSCWHSLPASGKDRGLFCSSRNPNSLSFFQALITKARSLESGDTDHPRSLWDLRYGQTPPRFLPTVQGDCVIFCQILAGSRQISQAREGWFYVSPNVKLPCRLHVGRRRIPQAHVHGVRTAEGRTGPDPVLWPQLNVGLQSLACFVYKMV